MSKLLRALLDKRTQQLASASAITKKAGDESRELSAEDSIAVDAALASVGSLDKQIASERALIEAQRNESGVAIDGEFISVEDNRTKDAKHGFKSFGEFAVAVRKSNAPGHAVLDDRLKIGAASPGSVYSNENAGADGGYLVPSEFSNEIAKLSLESDAFLPMCDNMPVSGNSITFPSDETTPWGSNGIRVYWAAEAAQALATKPVIKPNVMRLNKLFGLVPITDELLDDAPTMGAYLAMNLGRTIKWKVNDSIINGTGAGQPLGILNAPALVTVAKETGQATLTLNATNIAKMYAAMPVDYLSKAVWLVTPDLMPQLMIMTLGNFAIWTPPTVGFANAPGGFLFGKPVIITQTCAAFSSKGDIIFTNFQAYRTISKEGIQLAQSLHLYFDYDSTAFRATFRVDGQPTFKQPIAQARAAQQLSPYVTLAAR